MDVREKLIKLLSDNFVDFINVDIVAGNCKIRAITFNADDFADCLIANGVTIQKWIPVSERLPDENQVVLCMRRNGSYWVAQWTYIDWMWYDENEWRTEKEVTHWMPLPEPPKEDV